MDEGRKRVLGNHGSDSCGTEARELGRATFSCIGVRHCGWDHNCGADHGKDRQQVACEVARRNCDRRESGRGVVPSE